MNQNYFRGTKPEFGTVVIRIADTDEIQIL